MTVGLGVDSSVTCIYGNYRDFIRVMVFYLFCRRSWRIIVITVFGYTVYIYSLINDIYIGDQSGNSLLKLPWHIYIHIYSLRY